MAYGLAVGTAVGVIGTIDAAVFGRFDPDVRASIVVLRIQLPGAASLSPLRYVDFLAYQERLGSFELLAGIARSELKADLGSGSVLVNGEDFTSDLPRLLRLPGTPGRVATGQEVGVYVGRRYWQGLSAGSGSSDRTVRVDSSLADVLGTPPRWFEDWRSPAVVWRPLGPAIEKQLRESGVFAVTVIGRLRPGVTIEAAQAEIDALPRDIERHGTDHGLRVLAVPIVDDAVPRTVQVALWLALAFAGVLLVACALTLLDLLVGARPDQRADLWIRHVLGASPRRVLRREFTEALWPALVCGAVGAAVMMSLAGVVRHWHPTLAPVHAHSSPWRLVVITAAVLFPMSTMIAGARVLAAIDVIRSPVWRLSSQSGARGRSAASPRQVLLGCNTAAAVIVLASAVIVGRAAWWLRHVDLGYAPDRVLVVQLLLPSQKGANSRDGVAEFQANLGQIMESVRLLPGVDTVAASSQVPIPNAASTVSLRLESGLTYLNGGPQRALTPGLNHVTADYFKVLGVPVIRGSVFRDSETWEDRRIVVIDSTMSRLHWQPDIPLQRRLRFDRNEPWREIVGVVGPARVGSVWADFAPQAYVPLTERPRQRLFLLVRARVPSSLQAAVERRVREFSPGVTIISAHPLSDSVATSYAETSYLAFVLGILAVVATVGAVGSAVSTVVRSIQCRYHELGIRMALGVGVWRLTAFICRDLGLPFGAGLVLGGLSLWVTRGFLAPVLPGQDDSSTVPVLIVVGAALTASCLAVAVLPISRLTKKPIAEFLRSE